MEYTIEQKAKIFKAFADEKRLKILQFLQAGERCICFLIDEMEIGQSSISYHMKILCESGVVRARHEGKWTHYSLCKDGGEEVLRLLETMLEKTEQSEPCERCNK